MLPSQVIGSSDPLGYVSSKTAASQALDKVEKHRSGQPVLRTPWKKVNELFMGGFRFGMIYTLAGASGHGKSYFLNQLMDGFLDPKLNSGFQKQVICLHFGFEMSPADEVIRAASRFLEVSYSKLLSLEGTIEPELYERFKKFCEGYRPKIIYIPKSGTKDDIQRTIEFWRKQLPNKKFIISIDHMLLIREGDRENEIQLLANTSKMFVNEVDDDTMYILLAQLNADIEGEKRLTTARLQYPLKKDVHGSKQLFHASDVVAVIHRPELLNIELYGPEEMPTFNTTFIHVIKYRSYKQGLTRIYNNLDNGRFDDFTEEHESVASNGIHNNYSME